MATIRSTDSALAAWPVRRTVTSSSNNRSTRATSPGSPPTVISLPRTEMSVVGNACSTTRSSSSLVPRTATIGWLAGTTIVVRVWGDSLMWVSMLRNAAGRGPA